MLARADTAGLMDGLDPKALHFLRHSLRGFFGLTRNPSDYGSLMEIVEGSRWPELFEAHGSFAMSDPEVAALVRERYEAPPYTMAGLLGLPEGSLGHAYASMMTERGLSAEKIIQDFDAVPSDVRDVDVPIRLEIEGRECGAGSIPISARHSMQP